MGDGQVIEEWTVVTCGACGEVHDPYEAIEETTRTASTMTLRFKCSCGRTHRRIAIIDVFEEGESGYDD